MVMEPGKLRKLFDARNALTVNAWNHLAQTYDGNRLKAYVNGKMVADIDAPQKPNANPIKYLGQGIPDIAHPFKGSMDELRIWNRARTAAEIKDNYTKAVAPNDPDLLLYYSFNQGRAGGDNKGISSVTDNKGKFNGTLNNFMLTGASSNFVASLVVIETTANAATNITEGSFTANWLGASGTRVDNYNIEVAMYILEVAKDDKFTNLVPAYANLLVPGNKTSWEVTGLSPDFTYYYRVKAVVGGVTGYASNVIQAKTQAGFGNALNFDGDNDFVTMGAGLTLPESGWTEEMWVYVPAVPPDVKFMGLIGSDDMPVWSKRGPFLQIISGKTLHGGYGYGTGQTQKFFDAPDVLTVNAWNHIAQTYDGNRLKAYVNGKMVVDVEAPQKPNANPIKYLGQGIPDIAHPFKGAMDELRIWNRARTAAEIKDNYKKAVNKNHPDLLAYYDFNQGVAGGDNKGISSVTDNKGKFNGTLNNFMLTGASSNFVASLVLVETTANAATNITEGSFTANWQASAGRSVDNYILEVAKDDKFTDLLPGYANLMVPGNKTSWEVTGLSPDFTYYYRVKAVVGGATGYASNVIQAKTQAGFGNALNFDGENDFVTMGAGLTLPESGWTEEMWIYLPVVSDVQEKGMMLIGGDDMTVLSERGPFFQMSMVILCTAVMVMEPSKLRKLILLSMF